MRAAPVRVRFPPRRSIMGDCNVPSRLLREGILDSWGVNALTFPAEVFYRRLMSVVDDYGRFDGRPEILRTKLYPLKVNAVREADCLRWIAECEKAELIALYAVDRAGRPRWIAASDLAGLSAPNDKPYIQFHRLGSPRSKESKYPDPPSEGLTDCIRLQMKTDANGCERVKTDAPYSGSGSGTSSGSGKDPPHPPPGGDDGESPEANPPPKKPKRTREPPNGFDPLSVSLPFDSREFSDAWRRYCEHRKGKRSPVTKNSATQAMRDFAECGEKASLAAIEESIRCGYTGVFPHKHTAKPSGGGSPTLPGMNKAQTETVRLMLEAQRENERRERDD